MGLIEALSRFAFDRPHLLLVEAPGGTAGRLAVEQHARRRGWPLVDTPADADLLVTTGTTAVLEEHLVRVWEQFPGPRGRVHIGPGADVGCLLQAGRSSLLDRSRQRTDLRRTTRPGPGAPTGADMTGHDMSGHAGHDPGHMAMGGPESCGNAGPGMGGHAEPDMTGMAMGGTQPAGNAEPDMGGHAEHEMGGKAEHDMGGNADPGTGGHAGHDMDGMALPAGLGMAERAADRDGLKLDVLTVLWGPVLSNWPAGLVITTVLQGDVVQEATVRLLGDAHVRRAGWALVLPRLDAPAAAAVVRLDALSRLLDVAGWRRTALRAQRLRDEVVDGAHPVADVKRLDRELSRSRAMARMTSGVRTTHGEDVLQRCRRWIAEAAEALADCSRPPVADEPDVLHVLPTLLTGTDVAGMRLVVASVDLALSGADARAGADV